MAYLLYSLTLLTFISITALYLTRTRWQPLLPQGGLPFPGSNYLYHPVSSDGNTFEGDIESGLSSSNFDLSANVEAGDSRGGLDNDAKREILKIMKKRRLRFDEARRVYMEQRFAANGIGADGRPKDPKFVSFS